MNKKLLMFTLISLFLIMPTCKVDALRTWEITSRNECSGKIELALAKSDGGLDKVSCHDNYNQAKDAMNNDSREDLVIIESGVIIDAKYAVIDYDQTLNPSKNYIDVYNSSSSWDTEGHYIKSTQPDDAVVLDYDYNTKRLKIKVAGLTGWISKTDNGYINYDIVPVVWAKSPQYYSVTNDGIIHVFPGNVYGDKGNYSITIDSKPSMLNTGNYYSYDGHYFYTNIKTLINDYKNNTYKNSVNPNNPYYNFYQYLSFRTKTSYSADNINQYINSRTTSSSAIYNAGSIYIKYQDLYGVNAGLMLGISGNESSMGTYLIAPNNIFGLNAVDSDPGGNASKFNSIDDCIRQFAYYWISFGYSQPGDWKFKGANVGNKSEGANYKYASDPFWGEKAANNYYLLDKRYGFQDKKQATYALAVLNNNYPNGVYAKKTPNGSNVSSYYKYTIADTPVVVLEEVKDSNGKSWYKIQSDATLDSSGNFINNSSDNGGNNKYLWNSSYVYVPSENFKVVVGEVNTNNNSNNNNQNNNNENNNNQNNTNNNTTPTNKTVSEVVTESGYKYDGGMISNISLNKDAQTLINELTSKGATNVKASKSGKLATGDTITLTVGGKTETITVVITGDLTGDGEINSADLLRIRQHLLGQSLEGAYKKAAYVGYSEINSANLLKIRKYLLGQTDL